MGTTPPADRRFVRRFCLLAVALLGLCLVPASSAETSTDTAAWAKPQIAAVVKAGLMSPSVAAFRGQDPLDERSLQAIVEGLNERFLTLGAAPAPPPPPLSTTTTATTSTWATTTAPTTTSALRSSAGVAAPWPLSRWKAQSADRAVSVTEFDRVLVNALGLAGAARSVRVELQRVGLRPTARAGTETVARLLGLRLNHPAGQDDLELLPEQPITRAEAAYSVAQILSYDLTRRAWADATAAAFALPDLTPWQQRILTTAVGYVGYPYVWGGTSPTAESPFGAQAAGGFDCSGFVWRVYKLTSYPEEGTLAGVLRGRTTYQMAGEVGRASRISTVTSLEPGDVLFFGHGPQSKPSEIDHTGIYLGNGWMVHSSGNGTTIVPFDGWYRTSFAWARRPLREAGLDT
jgi:cell wall-associated NlpC family hydrolase